MKFPPSFHQAEAHDPRYSLAMTIAVVVAGDIVIAIANVAARFCASAVNDDESKQVDRQARERA